MVVPLLRDCFGTLCLAMTEEKRVEMTFLTMTRGYIHLVITKRGVICITNHLNENNSLSVTDNTAILNALVNKDETSCELRDYYRIGGACSATDQE